jgi:coenzyme F420-reducing hydrogenase delta subunit/DNA-binding transcriptional ArsR family regulator
MRLIRVMCSGRIDAAFVLRAFSQGADGVFIGACHLGECNYITHGNYHTLNMVLLLRLILEHLGLDPERLRMSFMSGAEANLFVENVNDFVNKIKLLGPVGAGEGIGPQELKRKLETATELVPYIRLVERERLRAPVMSEEAYYAYFAGQEMKRLFQETIVEKLAIGQIIALLRAGPLSTAEIARSVGLTPSEVSKHLSTSSRHRLVRYDQEKKRYALA